MAKARGHAEFGYPAGGRGSHRPRPWLRTAQLNAVGWAALIGVCLLGAGVGVVLGAVLGWPWALGLLGAAVPLITVVVLDRRRWARMETTFGWGGTEEDVARIVAECVRRGVHTHLATPENSVGWGEPVPHAGSEAAPQTAALTYVNRDSRTVFALLRESGIQPPEDL